MTIRAYAQLMQSVGLYSLFYFLGTILVSLGSELGLTSHTDDVLICAIVNLSSDLKKENINVNKSRASVKLKLNPAVIHFYFLSLLWLQCNLSVSNFTAR